MPSYLLVVPQLGFCRSIYLLSVYCSQSACIDNIDNMPNEVIILI